MASIISAIERISGAIARPLLRIAVVGAQVCAYSSAVFMAILLYGSFSARQVYPFIETLLHFSLAVFLASALPLLFNRAAHHLRRSALQSEGRLLPAASVILFAIVAVASVFCLPLLEPLYDAIRAVLLDGLAGRLQSEDPARMPMSAWIIFLSFTFFLVTGTAVSVRHSFGLVADFQRPLEPHETNEGDAHPEGASEPSGTVSDQNTSAAPEDPSPWRAP